MDSLTLPPIALSALPERTKDFILGVAGASEVPPQEAIKRVLNRAAAPFDPAPAAPVIGSTEDAMPAVAA